MMENPRLEEETIIKDVRNFFRLEKLKKETLDATNKERHKKSFNTRKRK